MSTTPLKQPPTAQPETIMENQFRQLVAKWTNETAYFSSYEDIVEHPAFQDIIGLGEAVVPLILHDLEKDPSLLVWALPEITGVNPVPAGDAGNIAKMAEAWLCWGREHKYRW